MLESGRLLLLPSSVGAASGVLPSVCELNAQITAVLSACSFNHIAYAKIDGLEGERKLSGDRPIHAALLIGPRITSRLAGCARQRDIRNRIDCIGSRLSPLLGDCEQDFD